jgi:hypothetical protein
MDRHGPLPALQAWHARALIGLGAFDEAQAVLARLFETGPDLDDPENLSWAHAEIPILAAAMAQREGDIEQADALERKVQRIIDFMKADWPQGALEQIFFLDYARERFEQAVAWRMRYSGQPIELVLMVRNIPMWHDFTSVPAGAAYIEQLELELAQGLEHLRAIEVPWLHEPELWTHPAHYGD